MASWQNFGSVTDVEPWKQRPTLYLMLEREACAEIKTKKLTTGEGAKILLNKVVELYKSVRKIVCWLEEI